MRCVGNRQDPGPAPGFLHVPPADSRRPAKHNLLWNDWRTRRGRPAIRGRMQRHRRADLQSTHRTAPSAPDRERQPARSLTGGDHLGERQDCPPGRQSLIRHPPPVASATITTFRQFRMRVPAAALASVGFVATILVMQVSTAAVPGIAGRQWDRRRLCREISLPTITRPGPAAAWTDLDAHRMVRVRHMVRLDRATGKPQLRLDALAVPPG